MTNVNRRAFVAPLCAAPMALLAPEAGACTLMLDTPVMRLFRQWHDITARANGTEPLTAEAIEDATRRRYEVKDRMLALPCLTAEDFIAKIVASTTWGTWDLEDDGTPELWAEARALLGAA